MRDTALSSGHDVIPVQPGSSRERRNGHVKIQHWHKPHDAPTSACDGAVAAQYWAGVPRVDGLSFTVRTTLGRKQIGRAHVCTPVLTAHTVSRRQIKQKHT